MRAMSIVALGLIVGLMLGVSPALSEETELTPPRLSFVDGQVSFLRPGAPDWVEAQVNTPLAPGDQLYTGSPGNLELQIGARAFVRGWANTQIGLENHDPAFLQFKVTSGYAAFDLRSLPSGSTVEVDTPNAAFTINRPGYYRADVDGDRTSFTARRGGSAVATPSGGESVSIAPSEEVVLEGDTAPKITSYAAPPVDVWDQWNYDRTNDLLDSVSARYVSPESYGTDDLDRHGSWRIVPNYGSVWIPHGVAADWAPYSDGNWILDPYYGWTWVDRAPWGWAPYHYGRWVSVDGYWAWAPGPLVARPIYAPALVAFAGGPGLQVGISIGSAPTVGWVALGWGEPVVPWWGRPGFIHRPYWCGWGGPHVVNDVVIHHHHVIRVEDIHHYHHMKVGRGVMAVQEKNFGRGPSQIMHVSHVDTRHIEMNRVVSRSHATPASYAPFEKRGFRPPEETLRRPVVATRRPYQSPAGAVHGAKSGDGKDRVGTPVARIVAPPKGHEPSVFKRPSFGHGEDERPILKRGQNSPPAAEEHSSRREPALQGTSERPGAMQPADRKPGSNGSQNMIQQQQRDRENHNRPAAEQPMDRKPGSNGVQGMIQQQQRDRENHNRPAAEQPGNRPTTTNGMPKIIQPQESDRGPQNRPSLPGQPANSMSPRGRERVFQQPAQQPEQSAPERRAQHLFQPSGGGQEKPSSERPSRGGSQDDDSGNVFKRMRR